RGALAVDRLVKNPVAFQRVSSDDVVIIGVLEPPDDAARLVFLAADRLDLHLDETILDLLVSLRNPGECFLTGLLQNVWRRWSGRIGDNFPLRFAFASDTRLPARWHGGACIEVLALAGGESGSYQGETNEKEKGIHGRAHFVAKRLSSRPRVPGR